MVVFVMWLNFLGQRIKIKFAKIKYSDGKKTLKQENKAKNGKSI